MNTRRKWLDEEDDLICDTINGREGANIAKCFAVLSKQLKRSKGAIAHEWYCVLSNEKHKKYRGGGYYTVFNNAILKNRKIATENTAIQPESIKLSAGKKLLAYINKILKSFNNIW